MNIIPIAPATLDIIEELNNGVRPELQDEETFFIYKGKDEVPEIINQDDLSSRFNEQYMTIVKICYLGK